MEGPIAQGEFRMISLLPPRTPERGRPFKGRPSRRAFSLIEILIVLLILSILSTAALFTYGSYRRTQSARGSAQMVSALFSAARTQAIYLNRPHSATFDLDRQAFWVDEMNAAGTGVVRPKITGAGVPADFVRIEDIRLQSGVKLTGLVRVIFWPDGQGTYAVVHLRNQSETDGAASYYSVRVFPSTGAAQVLARQKV